ncbi:unnamed protein product, partial [Rotaria sp. Silwood2]
METIESRRIKFCVLLSIQIPSITCYIGLIYNTVSNRGTLRALQNHALFFLLVADLLAILTDLCMVLDFLRTGVVIPSIDVYCRIWNFIDLFLYGLVSILMLWTTIERHIFIFHHGELLNTRIKRFCFHYGPLIFAFGYLLMFYIYIAFIHPCENHFDYNQVVCAGLCFATDTPVLGIYDQLVHSIVPSILICILNLGLWIRVIWQKYYRMRRSLEWQQH